MPSNQKGVALVTVLLVVAIAMILVSRSVSRSYQLTSYDETLGYRYQINEIAGFVEKVSLGELDRLSLENSNAFKNHLEGLALSKSEFLSGEIQHLPGWYYRVFIHDLQARLNINHAAISEDYRRAVERLAGPEFNAQALLDWLDEDSDTESLGAEDYNYMAKSPSYLPPNRRAIRASEIRLIEGITQTSWKELQPFIVALPEQIKTNINTVDETVLNALAPELDVYGLVANRGLIDTSLESEQEMAISNFFSGASEKRQLFSTESRYYDLEIVLSRNSSQYRSKIRIDIDNAENPVIQRIPVLDIEQWLFSEGSI